MNIQAFLKVQKKNFGSHLYYTFYRFFFFRRKVSFLALHEEKVLFEIVA
jgi:hypothetical protein